MALIFPQAETELSRPRKFVSCRSTFNRRFDHGCRLRTASFKTISIERRSYAVEWILALIGPRVTTYQVAFMWDVTMMEATGGCCWVRNASKKIPRRLNESPANGALLWCALVRGRSCSHLYSIVNWTTFIDFRTSNHGIIMSAPCGNAFQYSQTVCPK